MAILPGGIQGDGERLRRGLARDQTCWSSHGGRWGPGPTTPRWSGRSAPHRLPHQGNRHIRYLKRSLTEDPCHRSCGSRAQNSRRPDDNRPWTHLRLSVRVHSFRRKFPEEGSRYVRSRWDSGAPIRVFRRTDPAAHEADPDVHDGVICAVRFPPSKSRCGRRRLTLARNATSAGMARRSWVAPM